MSKFTSTAALGLGLSFLAGCSSDGREVSTPLTQPESKKFATTAGSIALRPAVNCHPRIANEAAPTQYRFTSLYNNQAYIERVTGLAIDPTKGMTTGPFICESAISLENILVGQPIDATGTLPDQKTTLNQRCAAVGIPGEPDSIPPPNTLVWGVCPK